MSFKLKRNLRLVATVSAIAALLGSTISTYQGISTQPEGLRLWNVANGVVDGFIVAFLLSSYTFLVAEIALKRQLGRLSFAAQLAVNTTAYVLLILFGRATGRYIMQYESIVLFPMATPIERLHFAQALVAAFVGSIVFNFLFQNSRLLGPKVLGNFVTGRYHVPVRESRVMMFMDLASSTTIAEQIGDENFLQFLDDTFAEFTEPILETGAEIYKYVGDEIILSWPEAKGLERAKCLRLFQLVKQAIRRRRAFFEKTYGVVPRFRAGVHVGSVVAGEMGDLKQEIAYVGDLMNTTARIAGHTRTARRDLLASQELVNRLQLPANVTAEALGRVTLRGKERPMELLAIDFG